MTTADTPATVTIRATATIPVNGEHILRDETQQGRYFLTDTVTITYVREYTDPAPDGIPGAPWMVTAAASGNLVTSGMVSRRRASRTYRPDPEPGEPGLPEWIDEYVARYHPSRQS